MKKRLFYVVGIIILSIIIINTNIVTISASSFKDGLTTTGGKMGYKTSGTTANLATSIGTIIGAALSFLGVLFLGLMIYAGFIWMTARGNEEAVAKARNIIIYALIGLVVVLAAYAITQIVGALWVK